MAEKQWRTTKLWASTLDELEQLKALLTLRGRQEPGASIIDRLVKTEIERVKRGRPVAEEPAKEQE